MKIGIYSGSFDPIHTGHAIVANYMLQWCDLDEIWIMITPLNPLKSRIEASNFDRLSMAQLTFANTKGIVVSDFEFTLPSPSYTYQTLKKLKEKYPYHQFKLIIGSDNWTIFNKWRDYDKIIDEYGLLIYPRPGFKVEKNSLPNNVEFMEDAPQIVMSSTFVREAIKNDKNLNFFIPQEVSNYIKKQNLYR